MGAGSSLKLYCYARVPADCGSDLWYNSPPLFQSFVICLSVGITFLLLFVCVCCTHTHTEREIRREQVKDRKETKVFWSFFLCLLSPPKKPMTIQPQNHQELHRKWPGVSTIKMLEVHARVADTSCFFWGGDLWFNRESFSHFSFFFLFLALGWLINKGWNDIITSAMLSNISPRHRREIPSSVITNERVEISTGGKFKFKKKHKEIRRIKIVEQQQESTAFARWIFQRAQLRRRRTEKAP